eukprot:TRINITY_DN1137_c0_g1_i1.p1 TRINITY_DN1137_c0_g1~~TRINITY_DN1137_c0_g1_i1.p1  ORF type:complete len:133 (-),score=40.07 TRINITY_DN1137_c0_g1_i1:47-445(-)
MEETQSIDEYSEAANIIRQFISLGPIARSMVVGGLNEIRGESILDEQEDKPKKVKKTKEDDENENEKYLKHVGQIQCWMCGQTKSPMKYYWCGEDQNNLNREDGFRKSNVSAICCDSNPNDHWTSSKFLFSK